MMKSVLLLLAALLLVANATTFFKEDFDAGWEERWVKSTSKGEEAADLVSTEGGVKTSTDARFYQYSAKFDEFSNKDKTLVFQFTVRHPQGIDCGGGYFKLLPKGFKPEEFDGDTPYATMFGPDICGGTRRVHAIITYKGENHLIKPDVSISVDKLTHVYTLIIKPDQTFRLLVDNEEKRAGNLVDSWDFLPPKEIPDPDAEKPEDWVDEAKIPDPEDTKPEDWDSVPAQIEDPDAKKPEDWDEDLDGEWKAPLIDNPEYKGEWKPKMIDNPEYKGPWVKPKIPNPDYYTDDSIYEFESLAGIGLEIWQVKSGTIFGNILVTDDEEAAKSAAEKVIEQAKIEAEEVKKAEEAAAAKAKAEAEAAAEKAKAEEATEEPAADSSSEEKKEEL